MIALFIILFIILVVGLVVASMFVAVSGQQRSKRDVLNALEMVPLLIHLPPLSEDTNVGGRDVRDVVDETISKAQIVYNIIASTVQKDKDSKRYGQKHMAFEIVGLRGFVYFYATVPAPLVDVVKQAIVSAYPSAALEESTDPNIFNEAGGASAVFGGEMQLKEPFSFPIATYQEVKRDAFQAVLGALANLDKEDGVAIQILFRPADNSWRKTATKIAGDKRKGKYNNKSGLQNVGNITKQVVTALNKPPEDKKDSSNDNDLSTLDRSIIDAIEDKTRHAGFEVSIRVIVSSNVSQRSQALLQNIVASFALFDAPGKNGFKFTPSTNSQTLIDDYILRSFKRLNNKMILNAVELATIFHFPDQNKVPTSQLTRQESKQVDGPRNIPEEGLLLGYNVFRGAKKPIRLELNDRQRHMYAVGQTGTGKSTFLENLALQDMLNGDGFAFVDPHGDTAEKLLSMVPKERTEDVIYFSPADMDFPMGLNLFEYDNPDQKDFLIQEALNMLYKLYDPQHQGIMGPRYEHLFRMAALTVMADPAGGTFIDIPKLFRDPEYVKQKLKYVTDQNVIEFWEKEMPQSQRSNEFGDVVSWFVSKFGAFLSNEMMRNIIGQTKSAFDLRDIMDNKKILLVNLSKGRTGDLNSKLLGMIFVMKFQAAAMSRANVPESERQDFCLYVDEFQNFSTDSFATIMSEARKFHLNLIVANQFTTQLTEEIRDAVFGNMGTIVTFRVGQNDVEALSRYFQPTFDGDDLLRIPSYNAIVRTLIGGVPTQPFSMATLPPLGNPNSNLATALKQLSAAKYGQPRKTVEETIFARMKTLPPAAKPFSGSSNSPWGAASSAPTSSSTTRASSFGPSSGMPAANRATSAGAGPTAPAAAPASSFLDEWLQKRPQPKTAPTPAAVQQRAATPVRAAAPAKPTIAPSTSTHKYAAAPVDPAQTAPTAPTQPTAQAHTSSTQHRIEPLDHGKKAPVTQTPIGPRRSDVKHTSERKVEPLSSGFSAHPTFKNISSEEIDKTEIRDIAAQLKHDLKEPAAEKSTIITPTEPDKSEKELEQQIKNMPKRKLAPEQIDPNDTVVIDQEGNLTFKHKQD